MPANWHIAVASRRRPIMNLLMLRARGQLIEIGLDALRFSDEEARRLTASSPLAAGAIEELIDLTEGWPIALQLGQLWLTDGGTMAALEYSFLGAIGQPSVRSINSSIAPAASGEDAVSLRASSSEKRSASSPISMSWPLARSISRFMIGRRRLATAICQFAGILRKRASISSLVGSVSARCQSSNRSQVSRVPVSARDRKLSSCSVGLDPSAGWPGLSATAMPAWANPQARLASKCSGEPSPSSRLAQTDTAPEPRTRSCHWLRKTVLPYPAGA